MRFLSKFFRREIEDTVNDTVCKVVSDKLPALVEDIIAEKLSREPDLPLSNAGFGWALSIALRKHWPDVDGKTAAAWLWDYIGVPFGTSGYAWTFSAAQDVAREYAEQFGEAA